MTTITKDINRIARVLREQHIKESSGVTTKAGVKRLEQKFKTQRETIAAIKQYLNDAEHLELMEDILNIEGDK